jgi:hypothetical protein
LGGEAIFPFQESEREVILGVFLAFFLISPREIRSNARKGDDFPISEIRSEKEKRSWIFSFFFIFSMEGGMDCFSGGFDKGFKDWRWDLII